MNVYRVPFIINHSHPPFIRLPCRKTGVVKEPRSDGKHRKSQCNKSRIDPRCLGVVSVVHQCVVLSQERRFVHHGKQEVEAGEISLYLFQIGNGQIRLHHKRPDKHAHQGVGQISARVLDLLDPGKSADLTEEHGRREVQFVGRWHR